MPNIDIKFDFRSDTPEGKDADTYSSTLRSYHQILWSKCLPNGKKFDLDLNTPHLLHHNSTLGEFFLSSDAIGHTYKNAKRMSHIIEKIPSQEIEEFYSLTLTIGAFIIFPSKVWIRSISSFCSPIRGSQLMPSISRFWSFLSVKVTASIEQRSG